MLDEYAESMKRRRLSPNTIRLRLFYIRKLVAWLPFHPRHANLEMLEQFIARGNWTTATQASVIASLKSFYGWGHRNGLFDKNIAADLYKVQVVRKRPRIASEEAILDGLGTATLQDQAMIRLGAECGLRVHEIAKLNVRDRDGEWLNILGKGGKLRTVYMPEALQKIMDELESTARHGNYFPGQSGRPMHPSTVWRHVRAAVGINTHALRHRAGTIVYRRSGHDLRLAQEFLGHASPLTTAQYVHVQDDALREAAAYTALAA